MLLISRSCPANPDFWLALRTRRCVERRLPFRTVPSRRTFLPRSNLVRWPRRRPGSVPGAARHSLLSRQAVGRLPWAWHSRRNGQFSRVVQNSLGSSPQPSWAQGPVLPREPDARWPEVGLRRRCRGWGAAAKASPARPSPTSRRAAQYPSTARGSWGPLVYSQSAWVRILGLPFAHCGNSLLSALVFPLCEVGLIVPAS